MRDTNIMKISVFSLLLCSAFGLIVSSSNLQADIFKTTDEQGNVSFSDESTERSEKIELGPINTQPFPKGSTRPKPKKQVAKPPKYEQVSIVSPQPETTIPPGITAITVAITTSPILHPQHVVQIMMNGAPKGTPRHSLSFEINDLYRGEHSIQANILDQQGKLITSSKPIKVYVIRPTVR